MSDTWDDELTQSFVINDCDGVVDSASMPSWCLYMSSFVCAWVCACVIGIGVFGPTASFSASDAVLAGLAVTCLSLSVWLAMWGKGACSELLPVESAARILAAAASLLSCAAVCAVAATGRAPSSPFFVSGLLFALFSHLLPVFPNRATHASGALKRFVYHFFFEGSPQCLPSAAADHMQPNARGRRLRLVSVALTAAAVLSLLCWVVFAVQSSKATVSVTFSANCALLDNSDSSQKPDVHIEDRSTRIVMLSSSSEVAFACQEGGHTASARVLISPNDESTVQWTHVVAVVCGVFLEASAIAAISCLVAVAVSSQHTQKSLAAHSVSPHGSSQESDAVDKTSDLLRRAEGEQQTEEDCCSSTAHVAISSRWVVSEVTENSGGQAPASSAAPSDAATRMARRAINPMAKPLSVATDSLPVGGCSTIDTNFSATTIQTATATSATVGSAKHGAASLAGDVSTGEARDSQKGSSTQVKDTAKGIQHAVTRREGSMVVAVVTGEAAVAPEREKLLKEKAAAVAAEFGGSLTLTSSRRVVSIAFNVEKKHADHSVVAVRAALALAGQLLACPAGVAVISGKLVCVKGVRVSDNKQLSITMCTPVPSSLLATENTRAFGIGSFGSGSAFSRLAPPSDGARTVTPASSSASFSPASSLSTVQDRQQGVESVDSPHAMSRDDTHMAIARDALRNEEHPLFSWAVLLALLSQQTRAGVVATEEFCTMENVEAALMSRPIDRIRTKWPILSKSKPAPIDTVVCEAVYCSSKAQKKKVQQSVGGDEISCFNTGFRCLTAASQTQEAALKSLETAQSGFNACIRHSPADVQAHRLSTLSRVLRQYPALLGADFSYSRSCHGASKGVPAWEDYEGVGRGSVLPVALLSARGVVVEGKPPPARQGQDHQNESPTDADVNAENKLPTRQASLWPKVELPTSDDLNPYPSFGTDVGAGSMPVFSASIPEGTSHLAGGRRSEAAAALPSSRSEAMLSASLPVKPQLSSNLGFGYSAGPAGPPFNQQVGATSGVEATAAEASSDANPYPSFGTDVGIGSMPMFSASIPDRAQPANCDHGAERQNRDVSNPYPSFGADVGIGSMPVFSASIPDKSPVMQQESFSNTDKSWKNVPRGTGISNPFSSIGNMGLGTIPVCAVSLNTEQPAALMAGSNPYPSTGSDVGIGSIPMFSASIPDVRDQPNKEAEQPQKAGGTNQS
ncbi:hypothetical protein DIPPA_64376 [Diplonema papillatum]|nr:hypothetical protein DIPPA_64376 [Diplonema papillatum]